MKFIYALWGESLDSKLSAPSLHETLRTAGATRLHVNVDDADVGASGAEGIIGALGSARGGERIEES